LRSPVFYTLTASGAVRVSFAWRLPLLAWDNRRYIQQRIWPRKNAPMRSPVPSAATFALGCENS